MEGYSAVKPFLLLEVLTGVEVIMSVMSVTQLCITCFVAPTCYYHIIARMFVYFTPLHTLSIFSDCNALNIQFRTCNKDVNMSMQISAYG